MKVPGYVVEDLLGHGGSGQVWRARAAGSGAPVALKRVPVSDPVQAAAARAEAAVLATLDHPHLIRLHEVVPTADAVVLVLDLALGGSLADLLARRGRLTPGEVVATVAPVAAALAYAHTDGVVHGDVSAANLLFTDQGLPLLSDLGVARIVGDDRPARSTPAYLDPVVARGYAPAPPTDVFMAAAVALHAATGSPLWAGAGPEQVLAHARTGDYGDLAARTAGLPSSLADLLSRALDLEPYRRGTAAEFALDLRHCVEPSRIELAAGREPARTDRTAVGDPMVAFGDPAPGADLAARTGDGAALRSRPGGAHRAVEDASGPNGDAAEPSWPAAAGQPGRPHFDRPRPAGGDSVPVDRAALTHGVRMAVRPQPGRAAGRDRMRSRPVLLVTAVLVVLLAAGAAVAGRRLTAGDRSRPVAATLAAPSPGPGSAAPGSAPPTSGSPGASDRLALSWLSGLDRVRAQAYATRAPALLDRVYPPGPLRAQDVATLQRVVPAGCVLPGEQTSYTLVGSVDRHGAAVELTVTASLPAAQLTCGGQLRAAVAGVAATRLHIELDLSSGSPLIVAQHTA